MEIKAPIQSSLMLCPTHSKTHINLFVEKLSEASRLVGSNPKKVSIKVQLPTGGL